MVVDTYDRPLRSLRLSVTDRCNLRCQYCMPEEEYVWLPKSDVLTFEEILRLVDIFRGKIVDVSPKTYTIEITGGEDKIRALLEGRYAVAIDDIRKVAAPALRHRLIMNFEGEAEGIRPDAIINEISAHVAGAAHVAVTYAVDADGVLAVTARESGT